MAKARTPCKDCGLRSKLPGRQRCGWCALAKTPISDQLAAADARLEKAVARDGFVWLKRVPARLWPEGHRWCASCQSWIPLDQAAGSQCRACSSRGSHISRLKRVYSLDRDAYEALLTFQGGRCYICGRTPRERRLAVDHDHSCCPGEVSCGKCVRGLLCSGDQWGCNHTVLGLVRTVEAAQRLLDYLTKWPTTRLADDDDPPTYPDRDRPPPTYPPF